MKNKIITDKAVKYKESKLHEYYLEYSAYMKQKYGWSIDEGLFNCIISWLVANKLNNKETKYNGN